ncbi:MAG TPA: four helix bundle protein [Vicinamibacterales bacterium]|jgi:four helix bundle protein
MPLRHHDLVAWQRADDLCVSLHFLTRRVFPPEERYELSAQTRKASYSIAANIVEGFARRPGKERLHFLQISWGSLAEVGYCLHLARRLQYLDESSYDRYELEVRKVGAPLRGLMRAEQKKLGEI